MSEPLNIRNIAIIAHVDHGKTTLVDKLLRETATLSERGVQETCVMDSNDLEKERGITILAKTTAVIWKDARTNTEYRINIVDTPGHADFGGEVERILSMVDSVLLLVDAVDGPMPQTRFVTRKAFEQKLKPILVVNKIDRPGAKPDWAIDQVFELFSKLGATDEQLDFPFVYASALNGFATLDHTKHTTNMEALFQVIVDKVLPPKVDMNGPFQMQISSLDYDTYTGIVGIGRISRGSIKPGTTVKIIDDQQNVRSGRIVKLMTHLGLKRIDTDIAYAGDIVAITGIENLHISDTICDPNTVEALPPLSVDEPTVSMTFQVNTSPFAGQDGKYVTTRQIKERLEKELLHNVALRVEQASDSADKFLVSGRGELHLSILIENMRREGYELAVSRPEVIVKEINGVKMEPWEDVRIDIEETHQGAVMEAMGYRKGDLVNMVSDSHGRVMLEYKIPSRGLIGFHGEFMTMTSGTGILNQTFDAYNPLKPGPVAQRKNGVLISQEQGVSVAFALWNLQERGMLFIGPQVPVYEGMIIGMNNRSDDMVVNPLKGKKLTNMRASGSDEAVTLIPPKIFSLEQAIEFIDDDELVEVTPKNIRIRKKFLKEHERRRSSKE